MSGDHPASGYTYGHLTYYENNKWVYADTGEEVPEVPTRKCPRCNLCPTKEGHDACLGKLPGVSYACCGHGVKRGYMMFSDGKIVRFTQLEEVEQRIQHPNGSITFKKILDKNSKSKSKGKKV
ncbi:MAG: hypothetical protein KDH96_03330 [Candidatus Riesia sp.]|nr:hypothetical protein [Candidatus Riesia sp.]